MRKATKDNVTIGTTIQTQGGTKHLVIAGPDPYGRYAFQQVDNGTLTLEHLRFLGEVFLVPLCYVSGLPVYKGDILYRPDGRAQVIERFSNGALYGPGNPGFTADTWSWHPPMEEITGWIVVTPCRGDVKAIANTTCLYPNAEDLKHLTPDRGTLQQVTLKIRK